MPRLKFWRARERVRTHTNEKGSRINLLTGCSGDAIGTGREYAISEISAGPKPSRFAAGMT
jgi:hypothetical protein